jgi:hypothetical protein
MRRCHAGHAVCKSCIESNIVQNLPRNDQSLGVCPAWRCTSPGDYLAGFISHEFFQLVLQIEFQKQHEISSLVLCTTNEQGGIP